MPAGSSSKRERQYEHIKKSAQDRGESAGRAKEIAATHGPGVPTTADHMPAARPGREAFRATDDRLTRSAARALCPTR